MEQPYRRHGPDAKKFRSQIKKLQGNEGHTDKKIYDDNGKETIFRKR